MVWKLLSIFGGEEKNREFNETFQPGGLRSCTVGRKKQNRGGTGCA